MRKEYDSHPHVPAERAELFLAHDGGSTEVEYLGLIQSLIRCRKPDLVLETGCFNGYGTLAIAEALEENGFGVCHSIDASAHMIETAAKRLEDARLTHRIKLIQGDTMQTLRETSLAGKTFGVAFFDSDLRIRCSEARECLHRRLVAASDLLVFHDTSRLRTCGDGSPDAAVAEFWRAYDATVRSIVSATVEFPLSRGMVLAQV